MTEPLPFFRSTVQALSGAERRKRKVLPISAASPAFCSMWSRMTPNASALVGSPASCPPATADAPAGPTPAVPAAPRSLPTTSAARAGSIFLRNMSFCDAMTSPEILSFFSVQSFIGSALPATIARKSASESSSVQSALSPPWTTEPLPFFRSTVHALSGPVSLKRNVLPISAARLGLRSTWSPMIAKASALVGSPLGAADAPAAAAAGLRFSGAFGISG